MSLIENQSPPRRRAAAICIATLALLLLSAALPVLGAGKGVPLGKEWDKAIAPLREMPVQQSEFVRSALTFGQYHLLSIHDKRAFNGSEALLTVLYLMADRQGAANLNIIKVDHPDLAKIFDANKISLMSYNKRENQAAIFALYEKDKVQYNKPLYNLQQRVEHLMKLEEDFAFIPKAGNWLSPPEALGKTNDPLDLEILKHWAALKTAIVEDDATAGAVAAAALAKSVMTAATPLAQGETDAAEKLNLNLKNLSIDALYQKHHPFAKSAFFYVFAALFYGGALLFRWRWASRFGFALLALGFSEELFGIVCRWILAGRAPLSNMYESFTFATGGMILVALIFEATQKRKNIAGLGGAILGFLFMVLAHKLPIFDSRIRPLAPALDSIWLTYHVVTIMLSYSAFSLSFFLALCYIIKDLILGGDKSQNLFARSIPSLPTLDIYNYKIVAVGFPLLTIGIVLGAVWANTAWGRAWGFDPKETWSAITWLIYAVYLHVRFIAGWKGRRAAFIAIFGFACVLFTYFGVNYWLPGLHSYAS